MKIKDFKLQLEKFDENLIIKNIEITDGIINIQCIRPVEFIKIVIKFDNRLEN